MSTAATPAPLQCPVWSEGQGWPPSPSLGPWCLLALEVTAQTTDRAHTYGETGLQRQMHMAMGDSGGRTLWEGDRCLPRPPEGSSLGRVGDTGAPHGPASASRGARGKELWSSAAGLGKEWSRGGGGRGRQQGLWSQTDMGQNPGSCHLLPREMPRSQRASVSGR